MEAEAEAESEGKDKYNDKEGAALVMERRFDVVVDEEIGPLGVADGHRFGTCEELILRNGGRRRDAGGMNTGKRVQEKKKCKPTMQLLITKL